MQAAFTSSSRSRKRPCACTRPVSSTLRWSAGSRTHSTAPFENALDRAFRGATSRRIVFDLRWVTFLDAAGLGTILRAHERARAAALELVLVRPLGTANRVFTLTRAGQELNLVDVRGATG
jgi:anti-anti-sigma factor